MKKEAFTIIESLIAIAILSVAVLVPLSIASNTLYYLKYSQDQMIANQLAQEAIETMKQKKDSKLVEIIRNLSISRSTWDQSLGMHLLSPGEKRTFVVDPVNLDFMESCDSILDSCASLYILDDFYRSAEALDSVEKSRAKITRFKRLITLEKIDQDAIKVTAKVRWQTGAFSNSNIVVSSVLYNWAPKDDQ